MYFETHAGLVLIRIVNFYAFVYLKEYFAF